LNANGSQRVTAGTVGFEPTTYSSETFATASPSQSLHGNNWDKTLGNFKEWMIQRGYSKRSIRDYLYELNLLRGKDVKEHLNKAGSIAVYNSHLKALKAFYKSHGYEVNIPFKRLPFVPKIIPNAEELRRFYGEIEDERVKAVFLLLATSGLRVGEVLGLTDENVNLERRMIIPNNHTGISKRSWVSFFNEESYGVIKLAKERIRHGKHFIPINSSYLKEVWSRARSKSGVRLKMKDLRVVFAVLMSEKGVSPTYIDVLCGRMPQSILARHYTDYSPERLKRIYDQAGLKVLS
jgi:integrase